MSPGCEHCYAEEMAHRFNQPGNWGAGLTVIRSGRLGWSGDVTLVPEKLVEPLRWRKPRKVFPCSGSDLFHPKIPFPYIAAAFGVMAATPRHTYQVLTKRPERMAEFFEWLQAFTTSDETLHRFFHKAAKDAGVELDMPAFRWPLKNVWTGFTAEDQTRLDERMAHMRKVPSALRWASLEPLLGPLDMTEHRSELDWVVVGGESGRRARPCEAAWISNIVQQLRGHVPVFVKQMGSNSTLPVTGKGHDPSEGPASLNLRLFP